MMKRKQNLAQAVTLGLLLTAPWGVMAAEGTIEAVGTTEVVKAPAGTDIIDIAEAEKGLIAANGGTIEILGDEAKDTVNITTSTEKITHAVEADKGKITIQGKIINITANGVAGLSGDANRGISLAGDSSLTVGTPNSDRVIIKTEGAGRNRSVDVQSSKADIFGKEIEVIAAGDTDNRALNIYNKGILNVGGDSTEKIVLRAEQKGEQQAGSFTHTGILVTAADSAANLTAKKIYIDAIAEDGTTRGIAAESNGKLSINGEEVYINSFGGDKENQGISASSSGIIDLAGKKIEVTVTGKDSHVKAVSSNSKGQINLGDKDSDIILTAEANDKATGIAAIGGFVDVKANSLQINVSGETARAVYAYSMDNVNNHVNIAANEIFINSDNHGFIIGSERTEAKVNGNLTVNAPNAITVYDGAVININTTGEHATALNGDVNFLVDQYQDADSKVNVVFEGEESHWHGNSKITWDEKISDLEKADITGLSITLQNGAAWTPTKIEEDGKLGATESGTQYIALNKLDFNGGVINLLAAERLENNNLTIESMTGTGGTITTDSIENKLLIENEQADTITVKGVGDALNADAIASDTTGELAQKIADTVVNGGGQTAANVVKAEEGVINGEYIAEIGADGKVMQGDYSINTSNQAISNMASIGLMTWRAENNDMNKRLGELRSAKGEHGVWVRMVRGESEYGEQNVKNQYNTYQLGYDEKLSVDSHWTVGAALSYTDGKSSFGEGSGENRHTGLAVYGSYLGDDGSFIDLIAKYARLDHEFDVNGGVGDSDYRTNGYSISAEYGKRFAQKGGFWLEPQVELTYGHVAGVNYVTAEKALVEQDAMNSFVGRVGVTAGKDIKDGNVYVRASYLYDFDGETGLTMSKGNTVTFEQDLGGGWFEVGVGTNINLSDATYLYLDVEKTYGGDVATPWQWNAGLRYSF